ncbi:MAG TPA: phosphotransferase family protein [Chloroflexota bacterium]|jgi:aminoglycoside phosphotransferase (APT) family kinase protein
MLETIPVRADERFDVARVAEFLRSSGLGVGDLEVEQFPAGQSNLTFLLRSGDWEAVLRRPPLGPVAPRAHDMAREFRILHRLHPSFRLAPQPYVLCEDVTVLGAPFYVMERRHGLVLDQDLPVGWTPDPALHRAIAESLVKVLVDLHAVDWQAAGLDDIGHPEGYMRRQVSGWIERFVRARTSEIAEVNTLTKWLVTQLPESPPPTMIHNDYKLNNVLLDRDDPRRITAVLDWEMATVGDPLSDLASLVVYWTQSSDAEMMGGLRSVTCEAGFPSRDEIVELYAHLSGRDLSTLHWYLAFSYFKVGVICQQIYYRWFKGQTHDERFAGLGNVAVALIRQAAATAGTG